MEFLVNANTYFGSGNVTAKMTIDGERVVPTRYVKDGFSTLGYADIPVSVIRKAKKVILTKDAYPGGKYEFEGSGRQLLKERYPRRLSCGVQDFSYPPGYNLKERILHRCHQYWKTASALAVAKRVQNAAYARSHAEWALRVMTRLRKENPGATYVTQGESIYEEIVVHDPGFRGKLAKITKQRRLVA